MNGCRQNKNLISHFFVLVFLIIVIKVSTFADMNYRHELQCGWFTNIEILVFIFLKY